MARMLAALALASGALVAGDAVCGTLDDIRQSKTLRLGFNPDAPPFSYMIPGSAPNSDPQGFMVNLCRTVFDNLKAQLKIPDLKIAYVPVNSANRFDAITGNKADLLCESTTVTLERRKTVDFSILTFIDGATFVIKQGGPQDIKYLSGKKVGVLPGTTTELSLRRALSAIRVNAEILLVKTNQDGVDRVENGALAAYFADRATLTAFLRKEKPLANLLMADTYLSVEPFALALRRGDDDFRLAIDRALSEIYRSGEVMAIFKQSFGMLSTPSPNLQALYMISGLPDQ